MARREHKLDMLPLLDVFMVILFVFATIQEGQLEDTTEQSSEMSDALQDAVAEREQLEERLEAANIEEREQEFDRTQKALQSERERSSELAADLQTAKDDQVAAQDQAKTAQAKLEEVEAKAKEAMKAKSSDEQVRQQEILEKLLQQYSVFEVEIQGIADPQSGIRNLCCYRDDPRDESWKSCGTIPAQQDQRAEWFRLGAEGLLETLRSTKGGNAMTIIRQDSGATFKIGTKLEDLVREKVPDQKVYNEGITFVEVKCDSAP